MNDGRTQSAPEKDAALEEEFVGPPWPPPPPPPPPPKKVKFHRSTGPRREIIPQSTDGVSAQTTDEVEATVDAIGLIFYNTLNSRWLSAAASNEKETISANGSTKYLKSVS